MVEKPRIKERTIKEIMEKVGTWRQLYCGVHLNGKFVKLSLKEAATKVGISRKSLDDYLLQIRAAKSFGFDFKEHKLDKVGVLRQFVRSKKDDERKRIAQQTQRPQTSAGPAMTKLTSNKYFKSSFKAKAIRRERDEPLG